MGGILIAARCCRNGAGISGGLRADDAIAEADTLLLTVPNQLSVAYNAHVIESILTHIAPALGWRGEPAPRAAAA